MRSFDVFKAAFGVTTFFHCDVDGARKEGGGDRYFPRIVSGCEMPPDIILDRHGPRPTFTGSANSSKTKSAFTGFTLATVQLHRDNGQRSCAREPKHSAPLSHARAHMVAGAHTTHA